MKKVFNALLFSVLFSAVSSGTPALAVPITGPSGPIPETSVVMSGEIEAIQIADPSNHWSQGVIRVRGQNIIIPANLLIDLPNEIMTLQELLTKAPPECQVTFETGLAKNDRCNALATGGSVDINATRTAGGNIIAGMVSINKGIEVVQGTISFIDFANHYFRVNGNVIPPGGVDDGSGTMVRVNDPHSTHTIQKGPGCIPGSIVNCSADIRFDIDNANYTFAFLTGFPACIPNTPSTTVPDPNCPITNRPDVLNPATFAFSAANFAAGGVLPPVPMAADSRRFAPIWVGDSVIATGNIEVVGGVQFLSARAAQILVDLTTNRADPTQPEYLFIDETSVTSGPAVEGHIFDPRVRLKSSDHVEAIDIFTLHFDPTNNAPHERLLYTTECNKRQGVDLVVLPTGEFDMFMRMDFRSRKPPVGFEPCLDLFGLEDVAECVPFKGNAPQGEFALLGIPAAPPAPALLAEATALCPAASVVPAVVPAKVIPAALNVPCGAPPSPFCTDNYNILNPASRSVVARGRRTEAGLITGQAHDIHGNIAQSGFYNLPNEFEDIGNIAMTVGMSAVAANFDSIPWLLDRRLSTNGCFPAGACEATPQPLTPFPFVNIDARDTVKFGTFTTGLTAYPTPNQFFATVPPGLAPGAHATTMTGTVLGAGGVNPAMSMNPGPVPIISTPAFNLFAPVTNDDTASTTIAPNPVMPVNIKVLANDIPLAGLLDPASVQIVALPANGTVQVNPDGTITYTPNATTTAGVDTFQYTVRNSAGAVSLPAKVTVTLIGAKTHTITALSDAKGTITPSSTVTLNDGESRTYNFTPNAGYQLVDVIVDGVSQGTPASYTFTNVKSDGHNIKAVFIPDGTIRGKVDIKDALRVMQIAVGLTTPTAADLLHYDVAPLGADWIPAPDQKITVEDALLILRKATGLTSF